jgi:predicted nuclease of predicted toxin-antitoxin system
MAYLYANENFPLPVVEELRKMGHDVLTAVEAGKANQSVPDEELLEFARSQNRAVLTLNRKHFVRLHESKAPHAGIVVCTVDLDFAAQARRIHDSLGMAGNLSGRLIRVNRP